MKKITILLLVCTSVFLGTSCSKESDEVAKESTILFTTECKAELTNIAFIVRDKEIIWEESETAAIWNKTVKMKLQKGDEIWLRAIPADGNWYTVKTAIFVDGEELAAKEKFCQAGTGCTHVFSH